ncbi:hypothetical protein SELR_pSRC500420 (plasmid) [Selenomonas ruminantium subsp. lactilytica TAM6421]|uniref:Uncharacterized protein n=1 Tax=Selenomonas ruminantium subsp. lactilytica (strain NBRC 103574 / TAM6421) TaxID=927704 RepID=I0GWS9_SELRL|nr:hypothetical protein [Selenomonas ruminantium]BAL85216.1 hypothetical protein SELR_pSRC500420 [Selenomonas ruminantium subsp. lactilytica TAM6421]
MKAIMYILQNWTLTHTFVLAFLAGWFANGFGAGLDLTALATAYGVAAGVNVTKYGIASTLNSKPGEKPEVK